ncbi:hypothetical protein ACHAP5_003986 [Fusarium lateritium]
MGQIKNYLLRLLTRARLVPAKHPRKQQNPDCLLLNLPLEILDLIIKKLTISNQWCLLQTCCSLYNSFVPQRALVWHLSLKESRKYRALIARDHPDVWISSNRPYIRFVKKRDIPKPPKNPPFSGLMANDVLSDYSLGALMFEHKHVQLSIKYSQLEEKTPRQKKYLKALLKPYETRFHSMLVDPPGKEDGSIGYYKACPKVVSGRYLLYTKRTFKTNVTSIQGLLEYHVPFGACRHQYTEPRRYEEYQRYIALDAQRLTRYR